MASNSVLCLTRPLRSSFVNRWLKVLSSRRIATCLQYQQSQHRPLQRRLKSTTATSSSSSPSYSASPSSPSATANEATTHFGYETVAESLKESRVGAVFTSVASSYDTMNDLMSLGVHRLWKDHFVRSLNPGVKQFSQQNQPASKGWNILDVAGGTGDIAFRLLDHATLVNDDHATRVTVADINPDMLAAGRSRALSSSYHTAEQPPSTPTSSTPDPLPRLDFLEANAENLSTIPTASIDLYTVAFGIRNFTSKSAALREAYRVLKPGGVFACLEFSKVLSSSTSSEKGLLPFSMNDLPSKALDAIYKRWSFGAIPLIGQLVAGDRDSYQYLVESIDRFPSQAEFAAMIAEAGFMLPGGEGDEDGSHVNGGWEDLTRGIAAIHKGVKPVRGSKDE
ncbi:MAG: 2-hexaprenyl-6-methoxy-1,4-benzoquinone methyltransferase [Sclerophora amabilis]|nr:MAG: 2-hexaprenyl-6-methoxy-1,4-benzoquinone methyltransferase [Sclerophora amabilis]